MLQLTDTAAVALQAIRQNEDVPEEHNTRLSANPQDNGDLAIKLEFVESAAKDDQVASQGDTDVYVDPQVADQLSESVLDIHQTDQEMVFVFRPQS